MKITPYLTFDGDCEAAMTRYQAVLGGTIVAMLPFEGSPTCDNLPPDWKSKIMHACLVIGDQMLMASDAPPPMRQAPQGMSVSLQFDDAEEGRRIFDALAEGGTVTMPYQETFWALGFGMLTDRFGTPWMINCSREG